MTPEQLQLLDLPEVEANAPLTFRPIRYPLWTEHKAQLIAKYLRYFIFITRHGAYIDGFAGPQEPNREQDRDSMWAAKLVADNEPKWLRDFFLCDADAKKADFLEAIRDQEKDTPNRTVTTFIGDFNDVVDDVLATDRITEKTASFCLLDQRTFECKWKTVEKIAKRKTGTKIEQFYFLGTGWLDRSLAAQSDYEVLSDWWGNEEWKTLRGMNSVLRANLVAERFKSELGYTFANAWPIYDKYNSKRVMYHMIHATDHPEAPKLMARAYKNATSRNEPVEEIQLMLGLPQVDVEDHSGS